MQIGLDMSDEDFIKQKVSINGRFPFRPINHSTVKVTDVMVDELGFVIRLGSDKADDYWQHVVLSVPVLMTMLSMSVSKLHERVCDERQPPWEELMSSNEVLAKLAADNHWEEADGAGESAKDAATS